MAIHIQRKHFDSRDAALATRDAFRDTMFAVPIVEVWAEVIRDGEAYWLVVTQEGELVTGTEPVLPGYERVR